MLIPMQDLVRIYEMDITGVCHVGAHVGEEAEAYQRVGVTDCWWIEGDPEVVPRLTRKVRRYPGHRVIESVVSFHDEGTTTFHRANNFQSSSMLDLGDHVNSSPDVHYVADLELPTRTLDSLVAEHDIKANFLNCDVQGSEALVLSGASEFLASQVHYAYLEVNTRAVYLDCARIWELDEFLGGFGFVRVETRMAGPVGWGDACWILKDLL